MAVANSSLLVGGDFTRAGSAVFASGIAQWDGSSWKPFGLTDYRAPGGGTSALFVKGTNLIVGGSFTGAGGIIANNIARWDGTNWHPLGNGVTGGSLGPQVNAINSFGDDLIVGGYFVTAGSTTVNNIATWDGTNWYALGSGVTGSPAHVYAAAVWRGDLYIGGTFTSAGAVMANHVAKWDGTNWSDLNGGVNDYVYALLPCGDRLLVGGDFVHAGKYALEAHAVAQWDGTNWFPAVNMGYASGYVRALCWDADDLYVGGYFTGPFGDSPNRIGRWDGTNWLALGTGTSNGVNGTVSGIFKNGNNLYVAGNFTSAGGISATNIAKWDGTNWSALGGGLNAPASALAGSGDNLFVSGGFVRAGQNTSYHIARWNERELLTNPRLDLRIEGSSAILSWPDWASDYQLEAAPSATAPAWSPIFTSGSSSTNEVGPDSQFFRLRLP